MIFNHVWLPEQQLDRIDSPDGRKYKTSTGEKYESVTSWLGRIQDQTWLNEWKLRVGEAEAKRISSRAAARGTTLHSNVEAHLRNHVVNLNELTMLDKSLFVPFVKCLNEHVTDIRILEGKLYSHGIRLAGTVDCVASYDDTLSVIDFKTSKSMKNKEDIDNYFLQCSLYSYMIEELYSIKIDQLVVLIAVDYENKVQVFKESRKNWSTMLISKLKETPPS